MKKDKDMKSEEMRSEELGDMWMGGGGKREEKMVGVKREWEDGWLAGLWWIKDDTLRQPGF